MNAAVRCFEEPREEGGGVDIMILLEVAAGRGCLKYFDGDQMADIYSPAITERDLLCFFWSVEMFRY